jgi:hypothetical protein
MSLSIHYTGDWPFEKVAEYGPQITASMKKLALRFPKDVSVEALFDDLLNGAKQLWLILEGEAFKSFLLSEIKENRATGCKSMMLTSLAGEGGEGLVELIGDIEKWAGEQGVTDIVPVGRFGWKKALEKRGYKMDVCLFRKEMK